MRLRWPWSTDNDLERRDSSYTDALVSAITANAGGQTTAFPTATAALEACAGLVGRSFAAAEVSGPDRSIEALTPGLLNMIGRTLIRKGEIVLYIEIADGMIQLAPASDHDVGGGNDPSTWTYRVNLAGPERQRTFKNVMAGQVVHLQYAADNVSPWRGVGPLQVAQLAGRLSAETVAALADESSGPRGSLLPVPSNDDTTDLEADLKKLKGSLALTEGGDWGGAPGGGEARWQKLRIGSDPPEALVNLHENATAEVYAACGINPAVFRDSQGTAGREAWRQVLFGLVAPLGRIITQEISLKLDAPDLSLSWQELRASDISGRARAFQSLVGGGMDVEKAAQVSGVLSRDS